MAGTPDVKHTATYFVDLLQWLQFLGCWRMRDVSQSTRLLQNIRNYSQNDTAPQFSSALLWKPQILQLMVGVMSENVKKIKSFWDVTVVPDISKALWSVKTLAQWHSITCQKMLMFSSATVRTSKLTEIVKSMGWFPYHQKWLAHFCVSFQLRCAAFRILKSVPTLKRNLSQMKTCQHPVCIPV